jgi:predicted HTH transcriptional regulator
MVLRQLKFKPSWRDDYFKVISSFANAEGGGNLIIGVDDDGNSVEMKN